KEVQPVLHDRAAEGKGEAILREVTELGRAVAVRLDEATGEVLIAAEVAEGTVELVCPRLRDRVHAGAGEAALPDIEGRNDDLELLDRLDRDRLGAHVVSGGAARAETKEIVVGGAIDLDVVELAVAPGRVGGVAVH